MLRYRKYLKYISVFLAVNMLYELFYPLAAFALTGGPSQPEVQSFTPVGTTDMVDLSTGAFNYNIPLLDVDGYPINISYHSGITMDQEASWVGLGWNINPGVVQRNMRGLPDDFNGEEQVTKTYNIKQDNTYGISGGVGLELFSFPFNLGLSLGIFNNTYKGFGTSLGISPSISSGTTSKGKLTAGLGITLNSQEGADVTPSVGLSEDVGKPEGDGSQSSIGVNVGLPFNSRSGIKGLNISSSISTQNNFTSSKGNDGSNSSSSDVTNSFVSFSSPTYTPTITMPMSNYSFTFHATLGLALEGSHPNITLTGYGSQQVIGSPVVTKPAYGYLYSDAGENDPNALLDFNREKDVPFKPSIKNLAIPIFTYDLFSASGQGTGGQYRAYRGDVGELFDHVATNTSSSNSFGAELGVPLAFHGGVSYTTTNVNTTTSGWYDDNNMTPYIQFTPNDYTTLYEPYYFKNVGEKTVNDTNYYNVIQDTKPVQVQLTSYGSDEVATNSLDIYSQDATTNLGAKYLYSLLRKTRREKRNQSFSFLTGREASTFGLDKNILSYPLDTNVYSNCAYSNRIIQYNRTAHSNQSHQMSEITIVNPDGKRYVYGIPAYNTCQKEVTFSVAHHLGNTTTELVSYNPSVDNSTGNQQGLDNYFESEQMPAYSHSFLLTGVLSPDYVDLTGDGISDDDLGQAVKINYTMVDSDYQWRIPYNQNIASYEEGFKSDTMDDKGSYIYGKKQIWYTHSIESKTMIAQFYISTRNDGYGVQGENGGWGSNSRPSMKLDSIALFSKADLLQHGTNALPIKVVHFVYDYSLCNKVDNFNPSDTTGVPHGKLTLKQIYFTYERNTEGKLNSYQFSYCGDNGTWNKAYNPEYNQKKYDRWGNYDSSFGGNPIPAEFPYTTQNKTLADTFARAWTLSSIVLPSGGQINISYESNDYAYVQNQRATQMIQVSGASSFLDTALSNILYTGNSLNGFAALQDNYYLRLTLPTHIHSRSDFYNQYLSSIDTSDLNATPNKLYFKFKVDVDGQGHYEYVPGYAEISTWGIIDETHAWILLQPDPDDNMNPITKAAWQFVRLNLPQFAYPYSVNNASGVEAFLLALLGLASSLGELFTPFSHHAINHNYGRNFIPAYSWIRLDNPTYRKFGGGARVKQITVSDNWYNMEGGNPTASYGQTYSYTMLLGTNQVISSGVATYEPTIGGDENPFREPLPYTEEEKLAPNNELYTELPLGESLYPGPGVVYRQVTVQNLQHSDIERTATGYTVNTFYTAYDFPTLNYFTPLDNEEVKSNLVARLIGMNVYDYTTASQGFVVETNDMAGKPAGQFIYNADSALISSTAYTYATDNNNPNHLNNNVQVLEKSGKIDSASVGKDIDMWVDMRQQETDNDGFTWSPDIDGIGFAFFILPILTFWPVSSTETTRFRSAAAVKYIYRSGVLSNVTKMENGSTVTTSNLLFNGETGEALLTKTTNEYNAPIYNFTYPALWAYSGMAPAYSNIGAIINTTLTNGVITSPSNATSIFAPGDEVEFTPAGTNNALPQKYWIIEPQNSLVVIDTSGKVISSTMGSTTTPFSGSCILKIMRSGHRNMGDVPIGSVVSMQCPIQSGSLNVSVTDKIVQANATLYSDQWATTCKEDYIDCVDSSITYTKLTENPIRNLSIFDCFDYALCGQGYGNNTINKGILYDDFARYGYSVKLPFGQDADTVTFRTVDCDIDTNNYLSPYYKATFGDCSYTIQSTKNQRIPWPFYTIPGSIQRGPKGLTCYLGRDTCNTSKYNPLYAVKNPPVWIPVPGEGYFWYYPDTACVQWDTLAIATLNCTKCSTLPECKQFVTGDTINPYKMGMLGNWRQYKGYVYYGDRSAMASASNSIATNITSDGIFNTFNPFWKYSSSAKSFNLDTTTDANWVWNNSVTQYNSKGSEIENKDALGRYSSALYGYIDALPTAVASNTKYKDIAFDNFEDYGFESSCNDPCMGDHFNFIDTIAGANSKADTTSTYAHSGRYSLRILPNGSASVTRSINYYPDSIFLINPDNYVLKNGGCIYKFSPDSGDYILSAWVKEGTTCPATTYTHDSINIVFSGSASTYTFKPSGFVIDGWQRYESKFHVPSTATAITVRLNTSGDTAYFDDIRLYPFLGNMKSYVYDPVSLRLMAELDENNYATFYEYDDEGTLVRVKKETDEGIMTIKENRSTYHRK